MNSIDIEETKTFWPATWFDSQAKKQWTHLKKDLITRGETTDMHTN